LLNLALGGGALLDLGIYPINTAMQLLGAPSDVAAVATLGPTGVDVNPAVAMRFDGGAVATAQCSLTSPDPNTARVVGVDGVIELPAMQHAPEYLVVNGERVDLPIGGDGLRYQVHDVHDCIRRGAQQSDVMTWQHTIELMTVLDRARECFRLEYTEGLL
jgi:predicted dehydrogenase